MRLEYLSFKYCGMAFLSVIMITLIMAGHTSRNMVLNRTTVNPPNCLSIDEDHSTGRGITTSQKIVLWTVSMKQISVTPLKCDSDMYVRGICLNSSAQLINVGYSTHIQHVNVIQDKCVRLWAFNKYGLGIGFDPLPLTGKCSESLHIETSVLSACGTNETDWQSRRQSCAADSACSSPTSACLFAFAGKVADIASKFTKIQQQPDPAEISELVRDLLKYHHHLEIENLLNAESGQSESRLLQLVEDAFDGDTEQNLYNRLIILYNIIWSMSALSAVPYWEDLSFLANREDMEYRDSYKIIPFTIADSLNEYSDNLVASAIMHGLDLHVYGLDRNFLGAFGKLQLTLEFLQKIDQDAIVIFSDAFDSFYLRDRDEIIDTFLETGERMLFGVENNCFPYSYLHSNIGRPICAEYPTLNTSQPYLNSGQWIGYGRHAFMVFQALEKLTGPYLFQAFPGTDQAALTLMFLSGDFDIALDYEGEIFDVCMGKARTDLLSSKSCLVHCNGNKALGSELAQEHFKQATRM